MTAPVKLAEHRARMRRLWNDGDSSYADIAAATGLSVEVVAEWLANQPGYPGIIAPRIATCWLQECRAEFPSWRSGVRYCSETCRREVRRRQWLAAKGKDGNKVPPRKYIRGAGSMSAVDKRILEQAKREAKERGTTRDAVLAEWKFVPERSTAP